MNRLEFVAGIMLTHEALHPGEPLYLCEALGAHGVNVDRVLIQQIAGKLKRRHGIVLVGGRGGRAIGWRTGRGKHGG